MPLPPLPLLLLRPKPLPLPPSVAGRPRVLIAMAARELVWDMPLSARMGSTTPQGARPAPMCIARAVKIVLKTGEEDLSLLLPMYQLHSFSKWSRCDKLSFYLPMGESKQLPCQKQQTFFAQPPPPSSAASAAVTVLTRRRSMRGVSSFKCMHTAPSIKSTKLAKVIPALWYCLSPCRQPRNASQSRSRQQQQTERHTHKRRRRQQQQQQQPWRSRPPQRSSTTSCSES